MRSWRPVDVETVSRHKIFDLQRLEIESEEERRQVLVLDTPHWINVIALTGDDEVVLIRQWRFGIAAPTLEIPGGMADPGEEPEIAARRELEEETGYRARRLEHLGTTHPNPAIQNNEISTWLATDLEAVATDAEVHGVDGEEITVEMAPLSEIPELISRGEITHSLVVVGFYLLGLRRG